MKFSLTRRVIGVLALFHLLLAWSGAAELWTTATLAGKLEQWLKVEEAARISGKDAGQAETVYKHDVKRPMTEVLEYRWKGNRKRMTTGTLKMERPVDDSIKVGWVRKATLPEVQNMQAASAGEVIPGVGEFAFFAKDGAQYTFYKNGVRFSLWVDLSNDPKVNTAKAVETAKILLDRLQ